MKAIIAFLDGKKTYLFCLIFIILQMLQGGSLEALAKPDELGPIVGALAFSALRAAVAKLMAKIAEGAAASTETSAPGS